ncbi:MAG: prepilin peptidase [Butyrivibrio sp.]|uniref:prepilin peptidase n=1 Tax=Butyrivibrio sp. TaxID=28121 RepID=UPI001B0068D8|nr:prepilin peptidase [Butyrivibrio sp.]MBO6240455.1 prepilin peptidase [Butyrivibrio sp.]
MNSIFTIVQLVLLFVAGVFDFKKKEISLLLIIAMAAISIVCGVIDVFFGKSSAKEILICLIPGACLMMLSLISRQSIGIGDGLIVAAIGLCFGIHRLVLGVSIALFISGIMSIFLIIVRKAGKKDSFPFVPFIFVGMVVSMFA